MTMKAPKRTKKAIANSWEPVGRSDLGANAARIRAYLKSAKSDRVVTAQLEWIAIGYSVQLLKGARMSVGLGVFDISRCLRMAFSTAIFDRGRVIL